MPTIRPSADLRSSCNELSELCHENSEPVFIAKNRPELYSLLEKGLEDERRGKTRPLSEAVNDIRKGLS